MPNFFYTDTNGQKQGPVNDQQLKTLVAHGSITPDTPLETDTGHKGLARQIPGLFAATSAQTAPAAYVTPLATDSAKTVKSLNTSFKFFWMGTVAGNALSFLGMIPLIIGFVMMLASDGEPSLVAVLFLLAGGLCALVGGLIALGGAVFMFVLLYQLWKLIPADIAQTTPGKAVGFCFIPFFNFYWVFIAYKGLGADMNKMLQRHRVQYQVNEGLGLTACILFCASMLPYIGALIAVAGLIVMIFFLKSVKDGAIAMQER